MRILGIDHIGIASADLGRHIEIFGDKLGLEIHDIHEKDYRLSADDIAEPDDARHPRPPPAGLTRGGGAVSSPDRAGCAGRC